MSDLKNLVKEKLREAFEEGVSSHEQEIQKKLRYKADTLIEALKESLPRDNFKEVFKIKVVISKNRIRDDHIIVDIMLTPEYQLLEEDVMFRADLCKSINPERMFVEQDVFMEFGAASNVFDNAGEWFCQLGKLYTKIIR